MRKRSRNGFFRPPPGLELQAEVFFFFTRTAPYSMVDVCQPVVALWPSPLMLDVDEALRLLDLPWWDQGAYGSKIVGVDSSAGRQHEEVMTEGEIVRLIASLDRDAHAWQEGYDEEDGEGVDEAMALLNWVIDMMDTALLRGDVLRRVWRCLCLLEGQTYLAGFWEDMVREVFEMLGEDGFIAKRELETALRLLGWGAAEAKNVAPVHEKLGFLEFCSLVEREEESEGCDESGDG